MKVKGQRASRGQNPARSALKIGILEEPVFKPQPQAVRRVYKNKRKIAEKLMKIEEKKPEVVVEDKVEEEEQDQDGELTLAVDFEVLSIPEVEGSSKYARYPTRITVVDEKFHIVYNTWINNNNFEEEDQSFELYVHGLPRYFYAKYGIRQEQARKDFEKLVKKAKHLVGYGHPYLFELLGMPVPLDKIRDIRKARVFSRKRFDDIAKEHLGRGCTRNTHSTTEYCDAYLKVFDIFKDDLKNWEPIAETEA